MQSEYCHMDHLESLRHEQVNFIPSDIEKSLNYTDFISLTDIIKTQIPFSFSGKKQPVNTSSQVISSNIYL